MDKIVFFTGVYIIILVKSVDCEPFLMAVYGVYIFCVEMFYYIMWR